MSEDKGTQTIAQDADIAPRRISFTFPLWLCIRKDTPGEEILSGTLEGGHRFIAVFTSREVAERHQAMLSFSDIAEPVEVRESTVFANLLEDLQKQGCPCVVVYDKHTAAPPADGWTFEHPNYLRRAGQSPTGGAAISTEQLEQARALHDAAATTSFDEVARRLGYRPEDAPRELPVDGWTHLVARRHPWKRQLFLKGRNMTVRQLVGTIKVNHMSDEEAATDFELPVEAIRESLRYANENKDLLAAEAEHERLFLMEKGYGSGISPVPR